MKERAENWVRGQVVQRSRPPVWPGLGRQVGAWPQVGTAVQRACKRCLNSSDLRVPKASGAMTDPPLGGDGEVWREAGWAAEESGVYC